MRLTVYDGASAEPRPRPLGDHCESGRGLPLIDALATEWGTSQGAPLGLGGAEGKGVWCRFDRPARCGLGRG